MKPDVKVDNEFSRLIPPLLPSERAELESSIVAEGCRDALVVWDGTLLDGHNRKEICDRLGKSYRTVAVEGVTTRDDARVWILTNQIARRNLTDDQRKCIGTELADARARVAKRERTQPAMIARRSRNVPDHSGPERKRKRGTESRTAAARDMKVSERGVRRAAALKKAAPELFHEVRTGTKTLKEAEREVRKTAKEETRKRKVAEAERTVADVDHGVRIIDFRKLSDELAPESVDLIFTDPPYSRDCAKLYGDLAEKAARILKPGGSLLAYCGQYLMHEILPAMSEHMRLWWVVCCQHAGPKARMTEYGIVVGWKPILWFVKGTRRDKHTFVDDVVLGAREKDSHEWQQAMGDASALIEVLSDPADLVFDPFCGGGTTAAAAKKLKRRWLTCDIDRNAAMIARKRISEA